MGSDKNFINSFQFQVISNQKTFILFAYGEVSFLIVSQPERKLSFFPFFFFSFCWSHLSIIKMKIVYRIIEAKRTGSELPSFDILTFCFLSKSPDGFWSPYNFLFFFLAPFYPYLAYILCLFFLNYCKLYLEGSLLLQYIFYLLFIILPWSWLVATREGETK